MPRARSPRDAGWPLWGAAAGRSAMQRIDGRPDGVKRTRPGRAVAPGRLGRVRGPDGQIAPRPGEIVGSTIYLARIAPTRFCAVGGHSPALWFRGADTPPRALDDAGGLARHDVLPLPFRYR